jgi:hypothetical protein
MNNIVPRMRVIPLRDLPARLFSKGVWEVESAFHIIKAMLGMDSYLETDDRRVLEEVVIPYFLNNDEYNRIVFVGCSWYTKGYNKWFLQYIKDYWTIEI